MDKKVAAPPLPGTPEDKLQLQDIQHVFDTGLPIVQRLRGNPDFVEMGVYENYSEESKTHRLTSGALGGSRGFGLQVSGCNFSWLILNQQVPCHAIAEPRDPAQFLTEIRIRIEGVLE
jgi:hypothetical protein